jgi:hypothetical protein
MMGCHAAAHQVERLVCLSESLRRLLTEGHIQAALARQILGLS